MCSFFICIRSAASAGSYCQSFPFECQHYYYSRWCNSRCLCLSVSHPLSFHVSVPLSHPLLPSSHQFCLTAIIMCVPNGIHSESTFSSLLRASLFFWAWHSAALSPLTLTVMGETEKAPCCCLASLFLLFTAKALTVLPLTCLGKNGHFDISHPWNVAAHGITCKHCSLLPRQLMTKIQPSPHLPPPRLHTKRDFLTSRCLARSKLRACVLFLFSYPVLLCLLVLTFNHIIKCTLLSCLHRSDYIFNSGFIDVERLWKEGCRGFGSGEKKMIDYLVEQK